MFARSPWLAFDRHCFAAKELGLHDWQQGEAPRPWALLWGTAAMPGARTFKQVRRIDAAASRRG